MAIALVGTIGSATQGASGASITPNFGQTTTAGNLLIAWVVSENNSVSSAPLPSTPSGWTRVVSSTKNNGSVAIYSITAAGSDTAPTFGGVTSQFLSAQLAEFSGSVMPITNVASGAAGLPTSGTALASGSIDTVSPSLVLSAYALQYAAAATETFTFTGNNGQSPVGTTNSGTSTRNHYAFAYAFTTGNTATSSTTLTYTSSSLSGGTGMVCTCQPSYIGDRGVVVTTVARNRASTY